MSWPLVKLGDLFDITSSRRVHQSEWRSSGVPFYRAREIVKLAKNGTVDNDLFIEESLYQTYAENHGLPTEGDIVVSAVGTLGVTYAVTREDKFYFKDASVIWLKKKTNVDTKFIEYAFKTSEVQRYIQNWSGATVGTYTIEKAKNTLIALPPLEEQKRIAAILDKADVIRRKRRQAIELADQFLRSVFLDMFGDPVKNSKGWEIRPIKALVADKLQNGAYYPKEQYAEDGVEMVHMSDVFYDSVQRGSLKRVRASENDLEKYKLTSSDLLISRRSLTYEGAAKPSLIAESEDPLIFESSMIRLTPNPDLISVRYLFHYLADSSVKDHFVRPFVTGATIKGISQKSLEQIKVMVPPSELQKRFSNITEAVNKQVVKLNGANCILENLFKSLTQDAFKGELTKSKAA